MRRRALAAFLLLPLAAMAHEGEPLAPHDLWSAWSLEPGVIVPLALSALLYARGARRSRGVSAGRSACFWIGWAALGIALVSPLHPLGESLFSAHMAQHEALMLIAAPLMVMSRPVAAFLWGMPLEWRRAVGRWAKARFVRRSWRALTAPASAWMLHAAALWLWHAPALFQATLENEWTHTAQHLSFLLTALLFWWSLLYGHGRMGHGAAVLYVFTTGVHTSILGALLTFAPTVWYPAYAATAPQWGLTALQDQQAGGLIMWVPGGVVYLIAGLVLFTAWLRESEAMVQRREREYAE